MEIGAERWPRPTLLRAALAAPLQSANRTAGVVALYRRDKDSFNRSELGMLDLLDLLTPRLGECLAAATENAVNQEALDQLERFVANEGKSMVLVRIDLDGNPSAEASADASAPFARRFLPAGSSSNYGPTSLPLFRNMVRHSSKR